ncbi:MAG: TraR/DksA family transcriptional regulator [Phycisphaeraceae bacterium]|nr:TraR/DksA family transcriptional regulator [Phycisphaeraceae bacterium]
MAKKSSPPKKSVAKAAPKAKKPPAKKAKASPAKSAPPAKAAPKASAKAAPAKSATSKAVPAKSAAAKPAAKPSAKAAAKVAPPTAKAPVAGGGAAPGRKGITIVTPKPQKRPSSAKSVSKYPSLGGSLLGPGSPARKPLIPSGPTQAKQVSLGDGADLTGKKSPFNKNELARFRALLMQKRGELIGDVKNMEQEALRGNAGSLSNLPQHMADQGSDAYDQALALDLAAVDRRLIKEIDDAIMRIDNGTYGLCELTGKPIRLERLDEIPWARHSIEAAREIERRTGRS